MDKVLLAVAGLFLGLLVAAGIRGALRDADQRAACEAKGGVFLALRQGAVCVKKDSFIN